MKLSNIQQEPVSAKDFILAVPAGLTLPPRTNNRVWVGDIEDQLQTGSCVANASVSLLEMFLQRTDRFQHLSRLQLYWDIREGTPLEGKDGGAYLSSAFKSANKKGIAPESVWPFDQAKVNVKPPPAVYEVAKALKVDKYQRVGQFNQPDSLYRIKVALAMGYQVTIAIPVYNSIYGIHGKLGDASNKYTGAGKLEGAHAMNVADYDDDLGGLITEQSWGPDYGDGGLFVIDYKVIADLMDAWTVTSFGGVQVPPNFDWTPSSPIVATAQDYSDMRYLLSSKDATVYANARVDVTGGEGPYTYRWTASDPSAEIPDESQWPVVQVNMAGWAKGEQRSIKLTCEVLDSTIPSQSTTVDTLIRVCNSVDIESVKGKAYRLYKAAFARVPDSDGLKYWIKQLNAGMELREAAARFMDSLEFAAQYGINVSDRDFLTALYLNVLGRAPDEGGFGWWLGRLTAGYARQDVLVSFSESPENKQGAQW